MVTWQLAPSSISGCLFLLAAAGRKKFASLFSFVLKAYDWAPLITTRHSDQ
jgi:hypothetical protein